VLATLVKREMQDPKIGVVELYASDALLASNQLQRGQLVCSSMNSSNGVKSCRPVEATLRM